MTSTNSNQQTRVLVAARLSRLADKSEASRIERDEESGQKWADANSATVVEVTKDRGVSGAVSPFDRPALKPWLTDPDRLRRFDVIFATAIDRLGRSASDLNDLKAWAEKNGKTLQIEKPDLVWPPPPGAAGTVQRLLWALLAELAEAERETVRERIADGLDKARTNGAFVGKPTFGHRVTGPKYARTLEVDPALRPVLRELVDRALAGASFVDLARWLDTQVPPKHAGRSVRSGKGGTTTGSDLWSSITVAGILRSEDLKGRRAEAGHVHKFDGLLSAAEWATLQAKLPKGQRGPTTNETAVLTGVIKCEKCGGSMYRYADTSKTRAGLFNYRCKGTDQVRSTCRNMVYLEDIEAWVDLWFTDFGPFARVELIETTIVPGDDHAAEIEDAVADLRALDPTTPGYLDRHAAALAEVQRLQALPGEADQILERPTGRTVGDVWLSLNQAQRRALLLASGVSVRVVSNAALRAEPGQEVRYVTGDPHKVIGTLQGITEAADAAVDQVAG